MHENPNPSGFRTKSSGIDISRVLLVTRHPVHENVTQLLFDTATLAEDDVTPWVLVRMNDEKHEALLNAFETYHSKR